MIVRTMRPEEIDLNVNLFRQYADEAGETNPALGAQYDENSVVSSIRSRLIAPDACWFSLLDNNRPVGFISGGLTQAPWNDQILYAHIEMIYVLKEKRSMDAFRRLVDEFQDWAVAMDATSITAGDIGIDPERTKRVYTSIGFTEGCFMTKEIDL
jgi:hypothetical protein